MHRRGLFTLGTGPPVKEEQLKIQKDVQSGLGARAILKGAPWFQIVR